MSFDNQAKDWDNNPIKVERAIIFAKEINKFIKPNSKMNALEFGCGTGLLSFQLKDNFKTITLVDNSEGMINVLKEKIEAANIKNFNPLLVDVLKNKLSATNFEVIYTLMTLHHMVNLDEILTIFNNSLNNNGYLCIADLVEEDGSFHAHSPNFEGHNGFNKNKLANVLTKNGFTVEYYNISYLIEKEVGNTMRKYPLFLMICKKTT